MDPVPDHLGESIDELEGVLQRGLGPCPIDAYVVLLERLFTATDRPRDDAVKLWRTQLDGYPEGVLQRAVNHVIGHHKWAGPPKVAQVKEAADTDAEWADWRMAHMRLRTLRAKWAQQQRAQVPNVPFNPDIAGTVQAAAYASQRAMVQRTNAEQEQRKAERKASYKMSPAEEVKANAAARANVGMAP